MHQKLLTTVRLVLCGVAILWGLALSQWLFHLRHGMAAARGWLMHAALLGVPFEQRSTLDDAIRNVTHVYETIILWLIITIVLLLIERLLTSRSYKAQLRAVALAPR